ncbi:hypothetical protein AX769_14255 [Frondihabitans sp. PAMC 28766]|nr:ComEC/Rec2 family competence protein [Frondihabitans sp. PAMC 28766]AMM21087.1 hypothetical protein AX769_14255 [Frondihabitans sp. PAMC 28766]
MIDLRLAIPAAAAWVTLVLSLPVPEAVPVIATASGSGGLALVGTALLGQRRRWRRRLVSALSVAALALVAASAVTVVATLTAPHRTPGLLEHRATASVVGTVTAAPDRGAGLLRILVTQVTARGGTTEVRMPVLVTGLDAQPVGQASELPRIHDRVRVDGALSAADAGGDLAAFMTASGPVAIESRAGGLDGAAATLRAAFVRVASTLPGDGAALLPGLSVGDTSAVGGTLDGEMTSAGLSHLTAVSGANCAVVVAAVLVVGALLRIPRLPRLGAAGALLIGFVVLVTPEPSVLRASVMAFVALVLAALGRPVRALPLVSLAVVAMLLFDPWLARSFAFALSCSQRPASSSSLVRSQRSSPA